MSVLGRRRLWWGLALLLAGCRGEPHRAAGPVRITGPWELDTLDPHAEDKLSNFAVLCNVYEALVRMDPDMGIEPALAETWESPDPLTWVFRLRSGVSFHSGRPLKAADVVATFDRLLGDQSLEVRNYLVDVDRVDRLDDRTVRIKTRSPTRIFLNKLSHVFIIPDGRSEGLRTTADGTGPFAIGEWSKGVSVRLVRNDRHWAGPAAVPEVELDLGRTPEQAIEGLLSGRYQLIRADSRLLEAKRAPGRFRVLRKDNLFAKYLAYDLSRDATPFCPVRPNPFKDIRVRRALHAGIDRHRLVKELWNYAIPATQPVPRFVFGFNPQIPEATYDLDSAKALLREAGLGAGFPVVLHTRRVMSEAARLVGEDLRQVGIGAEVRELPDAEFFALVGRRGATLWLNRFGCLTGDAAEFLQDLAHSADQERHLGQINYGGYSSRELDKAIQDLARIEKPETRRNAVQATMARVMEELVVVPLYDDQDVYAIDESLTWQPRSDSLMDAREIGLRK